MGYYRSKYKGVLFLFVSDDMAWCKKTFTGPDIFYAGHYCNLLGWIYENSEATMSNNKLLYFRW